MTVIGGTAVGDHNQHAEVVPKVMTLAMGNWIVTGRENFRAAVDKPFHYVHRVLALVVSDQDNLSDTGSLRLWTNRLGKLGSKTLGFCLYYHCTTSLFSDGEAVFITAHVSQTKQSIRGWENRGNHIQTTTLLVCLHRIGRVPNRSAKLRTGTTGSSLHVAASQNTSRLDLTRAQRTMV